MRKGTSARLEIAVTGAAGIGIETSGKVGHAEDLVS
jgi:hypothetical protein